MLVAGRWKPQNYQASNESVVRENRMQIRKMQVKKKCADLPVDLHSQDQSVAFKNEWTAFTADAGKVRDTRRKER